MIEGFYVIQEGSVGINSRTVRYQERSTAVRLKCTRMRCISRKLRCKTLKRMLILFCLTVLFDLWLIFEGSVPSGWGCRVVLQRPLNIYLFWI